MERRLVSCKSIENIIIGLLELDLVGGRMIEVTN